MEPKIRVKGFEGEWTLAKLNSIAKRIVRKNKNIESDLALTISAQYGLISQSEFFNSLVIGANISNYYLIENGEFAYNKSSSSGYPVGSVKRLDRYDKGILSTLYILFALKEGVSSDYITQYFDTKLWYNEVLSRAEEGARNHGLLNIGADDFLDINVSLPSLPEQTAIANFFTDLDSLIQTTAKKLEKLRTVKTASLQALFPQEGETVPRVRFKGFSGKWKECPLGKLFAERVEKDVDAEMLSVTMNNGIIKAVDNGRHDNSNSDKSHYKVVKIGDIAYNSMRMWQGASGCSVYEGIVSPAYTVVSPQNGVDSLFFSYLFKTNEALKLFTLNSQGLTPDTWNLKYPAFSKISMLYPSDIVEQRKIASYLQALDTQISLQSKRLEKLKQIKSACLDNMFV